jgi:hypothetical protein
LERLPPKIQKIQQELPAWIQRTNGASQAGALMQKLKEQLNAKNFAEAEKLADALLKMIATP